MTKEQLILKLNWFYTLELNQVDLYLSQSQTFKDAYLGLAFERIAYIEQQHVENIAEKIRELGGQPTKLGDILAPLIGKVAGKLLSLSGAENTLKINICIEERAIQDYYNLINSLEKGHQHKELLQVLKHNLVDEDLHIAWFTNQLNSTLQ